MSRGGAQGLLSRSPRWDERAPRRGAAQRAPCLVGRGAGARGGAVTRRLPAGADAAEARRAVRDSRRQQHRRRGRGAGIRWKRHGHAERDALLPDALRHVCERFNFATAESDYEECGAFHAAQRNQAWYALWNPSNPNSPLNLHKDGSTVARRCSRSVSSRRGNGIEDLAQVRYLKAERAGKPRARRVNASRTGLPPSSTPTGRPRRIRGAALESAGVQGRGAQPVSRRRRRPAGNSG